MAPPRRPRRTPTIRSATESRKQHRPPRRSTQVSTTRLRQFAARHLIRKWSMAPRPEPQSFVMYTRIILPQPRSRPTPMATWRSGSLCALWFVAREWQHWHDNSRTAVHWTFSDASGLSYLNARYYNPTQGQFLSEDPTFLSVGNPTQVEGLTGENVQRYLSDPQQLNSYGYARDNPIINKDPSGDAFEVDDAAGFVGRGAIGSVTYYLVSVATHQTPTWSGAAGAFVTGGIIGWGTVNTPETLGASDAVAASVLTGWDAGYYGNLTQQEIDIATGKQKGNLNYGDLAVSGVTTAGTNGVLSAPSLDAAIPGYSSGQGNMYATAQSMLTKQANGTINNIFLST
jgi:RHS repeat-associated protein